MEWIRCEERLPEPNKAVLTIWRKINRLQGYWVDYCHVLIYDGKEWFGDIGVPIGKVTHWMPLPKLPKED